MSGIKQQKRNLWFPGKGREKKQGDSTRCSIEYHTAAGGLSPGDYVIPGVVLELVDNIDEIVDKFFENAVIDELNSGTFLDDYIDNIIELGKNHLEQQALEHKYMIEGIQSVERGELLSCLSEQREINKRIEEESCSREGQDNDKTPKCIYQEVIA